MTDSFAIEAQGICKTYRTPRTWRQLVTRPLTPRRQAALDDVHLEIGWGELHALVGPNGAGKTTLLKLLCTLLLPESGTARVAGYDVESQAAEVRKRAGLVVSDERSFYWRLSGRHNLDFFAALYGMDARQRQARVEEVAAWLGLEDVLDRPFREYSTGMRQKLAICRGMLHSPRVLLLDEPTRGIDLDALRGLRAALRSFAAEGGTALLASHDLAEIETLDCRVSIIDRGTVIASGTADELKRELGVPDEYVLIAEELPDTPPAQPGIADWERETGTGGHARVVVTLEPGAAIGDVLAGLASHGVHVASITQRGPNLEAVLDRRHDTPPDPKAEAAA